MSQDSRAIRVTEQRLSRATEIIDCHPSLLWGDELCELNNLLVLKRVSLMKMNFWFGIAIVNIVFIYATNYLIFIQLICEHS